MPSAGPHGVEGACVATQSRSSSRFPIESAELFAQVVRKDFVFVMDVEKYRISP